MRLWVRVLRGLALAGFVLGGVFVGLCAASLATAESRRGAIRIARSSSRATGASRATRSAPISVSGPASGSMPPRSTKASRRCSRPACSRTCARTSPGGRLIITVVENSGHQPRPVRGQQARQGRAAHCRRSSRSRAARCRARRCSPTCSASSKSTGATAATTSASRRRSSTGRTTASISCSRSPRAARPRSRTSIFVGNRAYSNWRLKDVIKTGKSNILSFLKTNNLYDPDRVESDRDLLRRLYLKNGYADVQIVSAVAEFDPVAQGLHPHLHDRGRRALQVRRDRHPVERARRRSRRCCAAGCAASRRARPTTPKRSRSRSRR